MAEPPSVGRTEPNDAPAKEAGGVRRWISELSRIATTVITVRERMEAVVDENRHLRAQVERLSEIVAHQAGQLEQLDKRVEDLVELQVMKRLEGRKPRSGRN